MTVEEAALGSSVSTSELAETISRNISFLKCLITPSVGISRNQYRKLIAL